ncbi:unnamed protein product [Echinostoma caproni]|uniref:DJ-1_PfpI domain-containing protein n=1 Tax=Echinostoma caproni TaxID=27848 RepID=A0A183A8L1_9TREM|nr:unnamed protein product [Echinostoma caproni]
MLAVCLILPMSGLVHAQEPNSSLTAVLLIPPDFEAIEVATALSVLVEAGITVITASTTADVNPIQGLTNVQIIPDKALPTLNEPLYTALLLTGGEAAVWNMIENPPLLDLIQFYGHENRVIGAINITPKLLQACDVYRGHTITASWAVRRYLSIYRFRYRKAQVDRLLVTGSSTGHSIPWAFALVARLLSDQFAAKLAQQWFNPV